MMGNFESANVLAGRYEIEKVIGRGGTSVVYKAYDLQAERAVRAIKEISKTDTESYEMAKSESQLIRELYERDKSNAFFPNIIHRFEIGDKFYIVEDYLDARGCHAPGAPLFAAIASNAKPGGGRLTEPSISRIIKKAMVAAGYDSRRKTAHSLRHTGVTLDRKAGASMQEAKQHAGHSSIAITQIYDHVLEQEEARDSERVYSYIFDEEQVVDFSQRAAELMGRIPASKREQAIAMLEALAE